MANDQWQNENNSIPGAFAAYGGTTRQSLESLTNAELAAKLRHDCIESADDFHLFITEALARLLLKRNEP